MNNDLRKPTPAPAVAINIEQLVPKLSDDAFYLIVLGSLLKKMIYPATLKQFLAPGSFVGFNNDPAE
ncbi:MAG TPA: hypothetical protein VHD35_08260 [Chitinophagaceae bacterium]|nr:hypothetical protein [Chitinophagaceae bacterium]